MAQVQVPPEQLVPLAEAALGRASGAVAPELARSADLLNRRAARLKAAADRLQAGLGATDPEVAGLRRAAKAATDLAAAAGRARVRRGKLPIPTADTWVVFGRVLKADGDPAARVLVRVVGRTEVLREGLRPERTDRDGDFALIYREADLPEPRPDPDTDLFVQVEGPRRAVLASSTDALRFQPGRAEYVQLVLPASERGGRTTGRPARAPAARPSGHRSGGRRARGAGPAAEGRAGS